MATCKHCGKPLILNDGKCIYCGKATNGQIPWGKTEKKIQTNTNQDWRKILLRKIWIAIIITLILGVLPLLYNVWPGCLVSLIMLGEAISLAVLTYYVINLREGDNPDFKGGIKLNLNNILNLILVCGGFFYFAGLICLFIENCQWWVWAIIVYLGAFGVPTLPLIILDPKALEGDKKA